MRIFCPRPAEGFEWVAPEGEEGYGYFRSGIAPGKLVKESWHPPRMRMLRQDEDGHPLGPSDFPWLGSHLLILRPVAWRALEQLLRSWVEPLPLVADDEELVALHVLTVIDALDMDASEVQLFPSTGRVMAVRRAVLDRARLGPTPIFKIPEFAENRGPTWVTEEFVHEVESSSLQGLAFEAVGVTRP